MTSQTYDNELTLISSTYISDEIGNQIVQRTETTILCCINSVKRSEFYSAATEGLQPALVFTVHKYEYDSQPLVSFEGQEYTVIRTYAVGTEELELTAEKVLPNGAKTN